MWRSSRTTTTAAQQRRHPRRRAFGHVFLGSFAGGTRAGGLHLGPRVLVQCGVRWRPSEPVVGTTPGMTGSRAGMKLPASAQRRSRHAKHAYASLPPAPPCACAKIASATTTSPLPLSQPILEPYEQPKSRGQQITPPASNAPLRLHVTVPYTVPAPRALGAAPRIDFAAPRPHRPPKPPKVTMSPRCHAPYPHLQLRAQAPYHPTTARTPAT